MDTPTQQQQDELSLCESAVAGNRSALGQLLSRYRPALGRMIRIRMPPALAGRLDGSDIVQEAMIEAARAIPGFQVDPERPFYIWLRQIACNKLLEAQRNHMATHKRDVGREVSLDQRQPSPDRTVMADVLVSSITSPSQSAIRREFRTLLEAQLAELEPADQEVFVLRHFEQLSVRDTAEVMGISKSAAGKRYLKVLDHLRQTLLGIADASLH